MTRLAAVAALALAVPAAAASVRPFAPYHEFMNRYDQGQSMVSIALSGPEGLVVYTTVLLRVERGYSGSIQVWSPDWTTRLTIPNLEHPIVEALEELTGGPNAGSPVRCIDKGPSYTTGILKAAYANPLRLIFKVEVGEQTRFFASCEEAKPRPFD